MTTNLMPMPKFRAFDSNGAPLAGGKVYTYEAGTNTELASYTDYSGLSANTNPVILDANGEANIWLAQQQYKIVLKNSADVIQWTVDNVGQNSLSDLSAGFGQATDIASATTVDLGTIVTHFANITGTTTINSFGSSAQLTAPIYLVKFNGSLTITNSANLTTRTGANITTATNDRALLEYLGSGAWRIVDYMRADAAVDVSNAVGVTAITNGGTGASTSAVARANLGLSAVGYIYGLTLSNNISTPNTHLDIASGSGGSVNGVLMTLSGSLTKRLDASWAVGNNNGGLDTGVKANSSWYHVFLIYNPSSNVVDALFSLSPTAPTMPSGYTERRRIGAISTNSSGNIIAFTQVENEFYLSASSLDYNGGGTTAATLQVLPVPTGVSVMAMIFGSSNNTDGSNIYRLISSPYSPDEAPGSGVYNAGSGRSSLSIDIAFDMRVRTNTSAQIRHRSSANAGNLRIQTKGWIDNRGQLI